VIEVAEDVDPAALDAIEEESKRHRVVLTAVIDGGVRVDEDALVGFVVNPERTHFFDLDTGNAIR
jgi:hypothetical protein